MIFLGLICLAVIGYGILKELEISDMSGPSTESNCNRCGFSVNDDWLFCPKCKQILASQCPECKTLNLISNNYCPHCGEKNRNSYGEAESTN